MPYWRTDIEQSDGRHIALFAESDAKGEIQEQFGLSLDGHEDNPELTQLVTLADFTGKLISRIEAEMGWQSVGPEDFEVAVETKRRIYFRDEELRRNTERAKAKCGKCGGTGKLVIARLTCEDCKGTGSI